MIINKKLLATISLLCAVTLMAMAPVEADKPEFTNLKVLPKKITGKQLHVVMDEWAYALGVRCGFCHVRNTETKKMDFASDGKPEKDMARMMYKMTQAINKKYFHAKKDSTNMVLESNVNCYTCHRGTEHPEIIKAPAKPGPGGPPPGKISGTGTTPTGNEPPTQPK